MNTLPTTNLIKIFIVDDHEIFRAGLIRILNKIKNVKVIEEAANGLEFLEKLEHTEPDIVLMDIEMPVMNGIEATKTALSKKPNLVVAALTMFTDDNYIQSMLDAGARGYLLKNISREDMTNAIQTLQSGKNYFSDAIWGYFSKKVVEKKHTETSKLVLTRRQKEILQLICEGFDNRAIAEKLFISERTVIGHKSNLMALTNCKSTASMITYAIKNKLVGI